VPTYQYACTDPACGHRFDAVQSVSDDPLTVCPQCEGRLRKVFSAVGVVFKGSGFYRTDSRAAANGKAGAGKAGSGKPDSGKTDSGKTGSTESSNTSSSSSTSSGSSTDSTASSSSSAATGSTSSSKAAAS
jgi:putative FmdB family regulatory protein